MTVRVTFDKGVFRPLNPDDVEEFSQGQELELEVRSGRQAMPPKAIPAGVAGSDLVHFVKRIASIPEPSARTDLPYGPVSENHDAYLADEYESRNETPAAQSPERS